MTENRTRRKRIRIGDLLVQERKISERELEEALAEQKKTGHKLGRTLVQLGYISEDEFLDFLSQQLNVPRVDLKHFKFDPVIVRKLPEKHARRHRALLLSEREDGLLVGMADPTDIFAIDELGRLLDDSIKVALVREADLVQTIDTMYRRTDEISNLAEEVVEDIGAGEVDLAEMEQEGSEDDAPVIRLLRSMFEDAVQVGASDIHIEPGEKVVRIRLRVDGQLQEQVIDGRRVASALVTRLKLMADLNISEKRLPQDGRFTIRVRDRRLDVRLSTMPIEYGESVVMRLLDQSTDQLNFDGLGIPEQILERIKAVVQRTSGMLIVTGPTGSGKTTTLYACLNHINKAECKIITVEDPVEYRLPRINQVQVNSKIGLDFSRVLRTALRQDPDVVMVGEMRDQETSEIGLRAAMTGHLVLSTLHTNNAVDSVVRLMDMGAKGYLVASSVNAVIAQRLIRRNCDACIEDADPTTPQRAWLKRVLGKEEVETTRFRKGLGCTHCGNTGYRGRIGVYEMLELDDELADLLTDGTGSEFTHVARQRSDYQPLLISALKHLSDGITSIEEVMRLGGGVESISPAERGRSPEDDARQVTEQQETDNDPMEGKNASDADPDAKTQESDDLELELAPEAFEPPEQENGEDRPDEISSPKDKGAGEGLSLDSVSSAPSRPSEESKPDTDPKESDDDLNDDSNGDSTSDSHAKSDAKTQESNDLKLELASEATESSNQEDGKDASGENSSSEDNGAPDRSFLDFASSPRSKPADESGSESEDKRRRSDKNDETEST